jgi:hypothetical protein
MSQSTGENERLSWVGGEKETADGLWSSFLTQLPLGCGHTFLDWGQRFHTSPPNTIQFITIQSPTPLRG